MLYYEWVEFSHSKKNPSHKFQAPKSRSVYITFGIWNLRFGTWDFQNTEVYRVFIIKVVKIQMLG